MKILYRVWNFALTLPQIAGFLLGGCVVLVGCCVWGVGAVAEALKVQE